MSHTSPPNGPLAFGDFLEYLCRQGFTIGVGDYLRLQLLLNRISGDCTPSDLKTLLCPILATSKTQQEQFYTAVDTYFELFQTSSRETRLSGSVHVDISESSDKPKPGGRRKWLYVMAGTLLLALALAVLVKPRRTQPVATPVPAAEEKEVAYEEPGQPQDDNLLTNTQTPPTQPGPAVEPAASPVIPKPRESFYRRYGNAIHLSLIFAPLILCLFYEWHKLNRRRLILERQRGRRPPFVWPLKVEARAPRLYDPIQLHAVARLMRRRQVGEFHRLDIEATVVATIAAYGYPSFRYKLDSRPPEYLVLIDRGSFRDHQTRLFDELAKALEREGLFIARYFYDGDPRVCRNEIGHSFLLTELQEKYSEHRLLVFGNGERIINPITGELQPWAAIFSDWKQRALLTPEAASQWGLREVILAEQFILLPATLEGLSAGVDCFELPVLSDLRAWQQDGFDVPPADLEAPGIVDGLRRYLGKETFQWLCACAVYPEIHWDLTLYLGSLACMPEGLVREENVSKLIRLPWFRSGSMPDDFRWLLIRELDREKERAIRTAIIEMMEKDPPPRETFAADAYQLNLVVQRWISRPERKRRSAMLKALKTLPESGAVRDYTVLRSLEGARVSAVDFLLPRRLRRLFYRGSIPAFGLRTGVRFLGALTLSAMALVAYFGLYFPGTLSAPHAGFFSKEDLLQRNIADRSNTNSCLNCHRVTASVQTECVACHTTGDSQTAQPEQLISGFQPAIYKAHVREGVRCIACHTEHEGQSLEAALVSYARCANCHNNSYKIKTGEKAGTILRIAHGDKVAYPVVNGKWRFSLTDEYRAKGLPEEWASFSPKEQFHSAHQMGRMENRMSCGDCHTKGVLGDARWRESPRAQCAACHGSILTAGNVPEPANCNKCHLEHGISPDHWVVDAEVSKRLAPFDHNRQEHRQACALCHQRSDDNQALKFPGHPACIQCHATDFTTVTSSLCAVCHQMPLDAKGTLKKNLIRFLTRPPTK